MIQLPKNLKIEMLKKLIEIRRFEERVTQIYRTGTRIFGYIHTYVGEEAVAVGTCLALNKEDYIISTHRGHGHCIAKGADIRKMVAELYGKSTGYCRGRAGSMHLAAPDVGVLGANGIVGGGIPISVGVGFSCKMEGKGRVTVCFFGDGAANNGVFHESLNMASVYKLPIIYICENNLYALSMNMHETTACNSIKVRSLAYNIQGYEIDGSDTIKVYETVRKTVDETRKGKGPTLIEAKTYRFMGHHPNDPAKYRDNDEVEYYKKEKDPIVKLKNLLLHENIVNKKDIEKYERDIEELLNDAVDFAEKSPQPQLNEFLSSIKNL